MSRGQRIYYRIYIYNCLQYTIGAYQSRAHFPSQHQLGPRTLPLSAISTYSWHGRNTCVCYFAPRSLYRSAAIGKLQKEDMHDIVTAQLCWKGSIACAWWVDAPFQHNYASASFFCRHAAASSRMGTLPFVHDGDVFFARV